MRGRDTATEERDRGRAWERRGRDGKRQREKGEERESVCERGSGRERKEETPGMPLGD